jgi:Fe-S cluster assembly protein SufD
MSAQPKSQVLIVLDHVDDLSRIAGEDAAKLALRRQARALLDPLVLPSRSRHLWRYSDPARFVPATDPTAVAPAAVSPAWRLDEPLAGAAIVAGGAVRMIGWDETARRAGVTVEDLHHAPAPELATLVPASHGFVEAVNLAAWRGGVLVRVPDGVTLEHPIRLRFVAGDGGTVTLPRVLVVLGRGASAEVVEGQVEGGDGALVLGVTELVLGEGAALRYGLVQRWGLGVTGHMTVRVRLAAQARAQLALASFGGARSKLDIGAVLAGERAEVETYGVGMGVGEQRFDHHTEHVHLASETRSNLGFKVAMTGASRSAYTGLIRIAKDAAGCEAYQENRNLLLSERARADSIPELEILNDDVRCSHGATMSSIDDEQLFYLQSRGLPRLQAIRLIVYGFLGQTLARLPQPTRERVEALIAARLHGEAS